MVPDGRVFAYVLRHGGPDRSELRITQNDVRAIQLAKAALQAGVRLLMDHAGLVSLEEIGSVRLAGAFGSHIDPLYALVLGLIPDCPPERVKAAGNAAGSGAVRALLSAAARAEIAEVARDGHQGRDGDRTSLPGALRRLAGLSPRHRPLPVPVTRRGPAGPPTGHGGQRTTPTTRPKQRGGIVTEPSEQTARAAESGER